MSRPPSSAVQAPRSLLQRYLTYFSVCMRTIPVSSARVLLVGLPLLAALCCTGPRTRKAKRQFFRMDTLTEVTIVQEPARDLAPVWHAIDSLLLSWEQRFSVERPGSEVYALNAAPESTVVVSSELAGMVHTAVRYGDTLDGGFDLTVLPLKRLWGLDENVEPGAAPPLPTDSEVAAALTHVDYRRVSADTATGIVSRPPGVLIDVGGIAKGAALDQTCRLLSRLGIRNYLVCSGGDIRGSGVRQDATAWIIAVRHPRRAETYLATLRLDSGCVVTSGDYERFRLTPSGQRIHHLFDPATGRSCSVNQSLTIWATGAVEADVLSTGLFRRPADSILAFVEARPRLECIVVDSSGQVSVSRGWRERISVQADPHGP